MSKKLIDLCPLNGFEVLLKNKLFQQNDRFQRHQKNLLLIYKSQGLLSRFESLGVTVPVFRQTTGQLIGLKTVPAFLGAFKRAPHYKRIQEWPRALLVC